MKKAHTLSLAIGAAFAAVALNPVAFAADNPFAMQKLSNGYQLAGHEAGTDKMKDGKCGEGKCGEGMMKKKMEAGKCGASTEKMKDGKCGEGMETEKKKDGKCGEGKCGAGKKK